MHAWEEEKRENKSLSREYQCRFSTNRKKKFLHRKYYYCNYIRDNFDCRIKHFLYKVNIIELV